MARKEIEAGKRFENKIKEYLESLGWTVDKARPSIGRRFDKVQKKVLLFSTPNDFFGAADLIAVKPNSPYTLFAQCTLGDVSARRKKLEAVPWNLDVQRVQLWSRDSSMVGGVRVQQLIQNQEGALFWTLVGFRCRAGEPAPAGVL